MAACRVNQLRRFSMYRVSSRSWSLKSRRPPDPNCYASPLRYYQMVLSPASRWRLRRGRAGTLRRPAAAPIALAPPHPPPPVVPYAIACSSGMGLPRPATAALACSSESSLVRLGRPRGWPRGYPGANELLLIMLWARIVLRAVSRNDPRLPDRPISGSARGRYRRRLRGHPLRQAPAQGR